MDRIAYRTYAAAAMAGGKEPTTARGWAMEMCLEENVICGEPEEGSITSRPIDRVTRAAVIIAARNKPTAQEAAASLALTTSTFTRYCRKWKIKTPAERRKDIKR